MAICCLRLSDVSVICRVVKWRWTSENLGSWACTECIGQGNDYELIPTVEMETINPVEGYCGSEFPAICNHCGDMAA